jgi:phospholipid/cholesterol/gamma-HCH transport system substrate-binding protein
MTEKKQRATDVKVGLFVALGILATFLSLFLVGQERRLWERTADLRAQFSNVGGLKVGGAVRLAGVNIGIVSKIELPAADPHADERVVKSTKIGNAKIDKESTGIPLALSQQTFSPPINLALIARDPDEKLEVTVEAVGKNLHGQPAKERILLRLRQPEGFAVGKIYFSSLESVSIKVLKDNDIDDKALEPSIQIGDGTARKLNVILRVSEKFLERIRTDSEASVVGEGLLGDKYIDISIGSTSRPKANDGDLLLSNDAVDFTAALADTGEIIDNVNASTESIRALLDGFRKAGGEATVVAAMESIQDIAIEVQKGNGLQMLLDKQGAKDVKEIVANAKTSSEKLDSNLARLDQILADVKKNDSLVHALLYADGGEQAVADARKLIGEATQVVSDVRTTPGFIHNLIYEKDRGEILQNANAASADIKVMTSDLRQLVADAKVGKGTVGRLLTDPSVYEDLKILLGNVRRNDAVKAIVRYAIEQEDKKAAAPPKSK